VDKSDSRSLTPIRTKRGWVRDDNLKSKGKGGVKARPYKSNPPFAKQRRMGHPRNRFAVRRAGGSAGSTGAHKSRVKPPLQAGARESWRAAKKQILRLAPLAQDDNGGECRNIDRAGTNSNQNREGLKTLPYKTHSYLRATMGSTRVARRAGM
jgi:hypothetical protein